MSLSIMFLDHDVSRIFVLIRLDTSALCGILYVSLLIHKNSPYIIYPDLSLHEMRGSTSRAEIQLGAKHYVSFLLHNNSLSIIYLSLSLSRIFVSMLLAERP